MRAALKGPRFRGTLFLVAALVILRAISELTGFDTWVDTHPTAQLAYRLFAILLFGGAGLLMLFWLRRGDQRTWPLFYRLIGVIFLIIAAIHATVLSGDPLGLVSE